MKRRSLLLLVSAMALLSSGALAAEPRAEDVATLVRQLASSSAAEAEKATAELLKLGPASLPTLRGELARAVDAGFKGRLLDVVERLETRSAARRVAGSWGERWYAMRNRGQKVGWLRLKTEDVGGTIVMTDELFYSHQGQEGRTLHTMKSRPDEYLTPTSLYTEAKRPAKPWVIEGEVRDGSLIPRRLSRVAEEGRTARLAANFTTEFAVMRLATMVPKTAGYAVSNLELLEKPAIHDSVLKFQGEENVSLDGEAVKASRYTLSNSHSADRDYWVDATGRLVKIRVMGRIDLMLTDEARARDLPLTASTRPQPRRQPGAAPRPGVESELPVFPGAEGFGTRTPAGRSGKVIEVTSLADSGPGTLRTALDDPMPRVVVFRVGGTIALKQALRIAHPFVTVAGQTAPGHGILLRDFGLVIETHDALVQHLRIRPGNEGRVDPESNDALQINGAHNVVLDHLSLSWGEDEVVQTWDGAHDVTFSWCLVSEALDKSRHPKGRHGGGFLIGDGSDRITVHHGLLAHLDFRSPLIIHSGSVDFVENVVYNWGRSAGEIYDERGWSTHANVIGNRYIPGPSSNPGTPDFAINKGETAGSMLPRLYARDNEGPHRTAAASDEFALFRLGPKGSPLPDECRASEPFDSPGVSRLRGADRLEAVLERAGATLPRRDAVDRRVVDSVRKKEGRIINSPRDVGAHPEMRGGEPPKDSDHDGMPDDWERQAGLDPQDPDDATRDRDGDGYTNLEAYLHGLTGRR